MELRPGQFAIGAYVRFSSVSLFASRPEKVFYKPTTNFSVNGSLSNKKGLRKIGKGEMGEVFLGCVDKECKKPVAIKISNDSNRYEYKIGKRIEKLSGMRMYAYQECVNEKNKKYSIIYTEFANSGTLSSFIKDNINTLRPIHLRTIVTHVSVSYTHLTLPTILRV